MAVSHQRTLAGAAETGPLGVQAVIIGYLHASRKTSPSMSRQTTIWESPLRPCRPASHQPTYEERKPLVNSKSETGGKRAFAATSNER